MNSYIERISLCSLVIFILIISHFETDNSKQIVYRSNGLLNYNNEEFASSEEAGNYMSLQIEYLASNAQNTNQSNSANISSTTVGEKETKPTIESNDITLSNNTVAHNENSQNTIYTIASGPNNNDQFEEDNTSSVISNNTVAIESPVSNKNPRDEFTAITKVDEITAQFAKPPLPPSGGEDPFAVPIDDFYGIFLLLGVSIIFGITRLKKLRPIESIL